MFVDLSELEFVFSVLNVNGSNGSSWLYKTKNATTGSYNERQLTVVGSEGHLTIFESDEQLTAIMDILIFFGC